MKTFQLDKNTLESFTSILGKTIYLTKKWDEPSVVLLDSYNDCDAFYQKLLNPVLMVNKLLAKEEINNLASNFWASNGHKYNWDFSTNKISYNEGFFEKFDYLSYRPKHSYESNSHLINKNSNLYLTAMALILDNEELLAEIRAVLKLPNELKPCFIRPILKAIIVEEMIDFYLFNHLCVFCRAPVFYYNEEGGLHHSSGPAIEFPNGESYYYWNRREVKKHWIINPEKVTREEFLSLKNIEDRRVLKEIIGNEKFAKLLNLSVIEIDSYNGQAVYLMCTRSRDVLADEFIYFIKVICNSTGRQYHICIPEEACNLGAIGALAWTFGMEAKEYQLLIET